MAMHSFHRGSLALDFVGTLGRRASIPLERLEGPADFTAWSHAAGLGDGRIPVNRKEFEAALALREAIAALLAAMLDGDALPAADVARINDAAAAVRPPALDPGTGRRLESGRTVRRALGAVAADAIALVADMRERLVRCELPECRAFLLSGYAGERRRWCSMERCGNVAKVRAYRKRRAGSRRGANSSVP